MSNYDRISPNNIDTTLRRKVMKIGRLLVDPIPNSLN